MKFEIIQQLDKIDKLYQSPLNPNRFNKYLLLLQGKKKKNVVLPIAAFNPMAKENTVGKLEALIKLNAEELAHEELNKINKTFPSNDSTVIQVGINLADDVDGSWSEHYTTDYKSKFEFGPMLKRNFCTPIFWTSEALTKEIIQQRVREYCHRVRYWLTHSQPERLVDLLEQEIYVQTHSDQAVSTTNKIDFSAIEKTYKEHSDNTSYQLKFNFFYGDKASELLGYTKYGIQEANGFAYAKFMQSKRSKA